MSIKENRRAPGRACVRLVRCVGAGNIIVVVAAFLMALPVLSTLWQWTWADGPFLASGRFGEMR